MYSKSHWPRWYPCAALKGMCRSAQSVALHAVPAALTLIIHGVCAQGKGQFGTHSNVLIGRGGAPTTPLYHSPPHCRALGRLRCLGTLQPHLLKTEADDNQSVLNQVVFVLFNQSTSAVTANSILSGTRSISIGAPQGRVSSPLLFTFYSNECTSSHPRSFAFSAVLSPLHKDTSPSATSLKQETLCSGATPTISF